MSAAFEMFGKAKQTCLKCHFMLDKISAQSHLCSKTPSTVITLKKIQLQVLLMKLAVTSSMSVRSVFHEQFVPVIKRKKSSASSGSVLRKKQKMSCHGSVVSSQTGSIQYSLCEPKDLRMMKNIIFVDLDNCQGFFGLLPCHLPQKTFFWLFMGGHTDWREPIEDPVYKEAKSRCEIHIHKRCGTTQDASDFAICNAIGRTDRREDVPKSIPFTIVSGDKGFEEIEHQYEDEERRVVVITPHKVEKFELLVMLRSVSEC